VKRHHPIHQTLPHMYNIPVVGHTNHSYIERPWRDPHFVVVTCTWNTNASWEESAPQAVCLGRSNGAKFGTAGSAGSANYLWGVIEGGTFGGGASGGVDLLAQTCIASWSYQLCVPLSKMTIDDLLRRLHGLRNENSKLSPPQYPQLPPTPHRLALSSSSLRSRPSSKQ
jgi:hypothetical protein